MSEMISKGRVGAGYGLDGVEDSIRLGRTLEQMVSDTHGRYYEAAARGGLFGWAAQAGVTSAAGLSATPGTFALFNPKSSGVNLAVYYLGANFSVAFAAAAVVWVGANTNVAAADVTGTAATQVRNMLLGNGKAPAATLLTAPTLPAAPVAIASLGVGLTGAITTVPAEATFGREFAGSLVVAPGAAVSLQTSAASGASATFGEIIWEEIPA